jgi:hypothetical protein
MKAAVFFTPFAVCPCEKHLIINTVIGGGLASAHHIFSKKRLSQKIK